MRGYIQLLDFSNLGRGKGILKTDGDRRTLPNIVHERRSETHDASSAFMPDTRVHHTGGSSFNKLSSQTLRCSVAARVQTISKTCIAANVMKRAPKISEEIDVGKNLFLLPLDFLEFPALVVGHFQFRGFTGERRIPRTALRPIEAASEWTRVRKSCVDNMRIRKAKNQFPYRNTWKQASFSEEAVVCSSLKLE